MIDTTESKIEEVVLKTLKKYGLVPSSAGQATLFPDEVEIEEELIEYMDDKQCLIWLGSNERGERQGVRCNQFYVAKRGMTRVDKALPLLFDEVFEIWEAYFRGNSLEDIFFTVPFESEEVGLSDLRLVIWALLHGKCNYMLEFVKEDRYTFDFKKYKGRF